ncbi:PEP-CTERM sorting domain-containing protein [Nitrosospira sp. Nl5]|uniref:PEP-CTERM sorting domain-containing protein n=1 Tax=Nitrosospira sp. Nl5 TaxID=200120 RepID=UPI0015A2AFD6|nr:PEP-CTERM sorting domain-containing protein [Nitrosospira sp. Nl5]
MTTGITQAAPDKKLDEGSVGKKWSPPPGLLSDSTITSLTFDTDKNKKHDSHPGLGHVHAVPEPGSIALILIGLAGVVASRNLKAGRSRADRNDKS